MVVCFLWRTSQHGGVIISWEKIKERNRDQWLAALLSGLNIVSCASDRLRHLIAEEF